MQKRVEELGDQFKEVMGEPRWNLGEPSTEPWKAEPRICAREPQTPRNLKNLAAPLLEPWWNLCWNLGGTLWNPLAAQDGSAPEYHRESESDSSPKPLLWLKTPKQLLLGKNPLKRLPSKHLFPPATLCTWVRTSTAADAWPRVLGESSPGRISVV